MRVPYNFNNKEVKYFKHFSIVSIKPLALKKYTQLKMGKIEKIEGIELLRAIENNLNIGTFIVHRSSFAIDVNQDLIKAIDIMPKDPIRKLYK